MKCHLCNAEVNKETAPIPAQHQHQKYYYCSQQCLGIAWPDAAAPLTPGDMFTSDLLAFENPRAIAELPNDERFYATEGFNYLDVAELDEAGNPPDEHIPHDMWAVMSVHPDEKDLLFIVPWCGGEEVHKAALDHDEIGEACLYIPFEAQSIYTAWSFKDRPEAKRPTDVTLFLGRGLWRRAGDFDLTARQQRLTDDSLKAARQQLAKMLKGQA